jgi:hypothetical protein
VLAAGYRERRGQSRKGESGGSERDDGGKQRTS